MVGVGGPLLLLDELEELDDEELLLLELDELEPYNTVRNDGTVNPPPDAKTP